MGKPLLDEERTKREEIIAQYELQREQNTFKKSKFLLENNISAKYFKVVMNWKALIKRAEKQKPGSQNFSFVKLEPIVPATTSTIVMKLRNAAIEIPTNINASFLHNLITELDNCHAL